MSIYKDYSESIFREFKSSNKEGLNDISLNEEERDNIEFNISQSLNKIDLNVDYSDFSKHVFFGSALGAVNFALARIFEYPIAGELKEKNIWKAQNSGFENYFFDQYPKRQGYAFFVSGSNSWIEANDYKDVLRPGTGSFAIEFAIKAFDNIGASSGIKPLVSYWDPDDSTGFKVYFSSSSKFIDFKVAGNLDDSTLSFDYSPYISQSHYVSFVFDNVSNKQIAYVDGVQVLSKSFGGALASGINPTSKKLYIGALSSSQYGGFTTSFTGALDDVRIWSGRARSPELIKRNYYKTISADLSGGLKAYYKFNETSEIGNRVIDYSSNDLHGIFSGTFSYSTNLPSGTLGSWFKDSGDPIFALANSTVDSFLTNWRSSGSAYDRSNRNIIFNLVPQFFIDNEEEHEDLQRFLLLLARHYDVLKLYIDHIPKVYDTSQGDYDNTPDELLNFVSRHYGLDLGSVYESSSPVQYFFGDDVLPSGSLDAPVQQIKNTIRRNLLNSLIYLIKTKSTRESLEASLRAMGLPEDVVNINEYSILSGGIETTRTHRLVERKALKLNVSSSVIFSGAALPSLSKFASITETYEIRTLFNTGSQFLTSSILDVSGSGGRLTLDVVRQNLTSSKAMARLTSLSAAVSTVLTSSFVDMYDNNWINFAAVRNAPSTTLKLYVSKLDRDIISFSQSSVNSSVNFASVSPSTQVLRIGSTSGPSFFDGHIQEFRRWSLDLSQSIFLDHTRDFESLHVENFIRDINSLDNRLIFDDRVSSSIYIYDSVDSSSGSYIEFSGTRPTSEGRYIDKIEPSYSYDIGINNDKIRTRSGSVMSDEDRIRDVAYVSVDMSPVISLNKEIMRWLGNLEEFNNITGQPYNRFSEDNSVLNQYRFTFFNNKINSKIDFKSYLNLIKWFDSNFSFFLNQLIPIDSANSVSNLVIESHLLEQNSLTYPLLRRSSEDSLSTKGMTGIISNNNINVNAQIAFEKMLLADPGRYGSAVSASAQLSNNAVFSTASVFVASSSLGLNHQNLKYRNALTEHMQKGSGSLFARGYGNDFHTVTITGSNYLKNVLNVNTKFNITGVHFRNDSIGSNDQALSSAYRPINVHFSQSFNGLTDQRWLWATNTSKNATLLFFFGVDFWGPTFDAGIGYGGGWGQLYSVCNKSLRADIGKAVPEFYLDYEYEGISAIGRGTKVLDSNFRFVTEKQETEESKTFVFWPSIDDINPIFIESPRSSDLVGPLTGNIAKISPTDPERKANSFGDIINIDGYRHLNINIVGKRLIGSTIQNIPIRFVLKFQFFNDTAPAENTFETVLSSSYSSGGVNDFVTGSYSTKSKSHEYILEDQAVSTGSVGHDFNIFFERPLPESKYMRIFTRVEFPNRQLDNNKEIVYRIQCKATATKEDVENQDRIVFTRRN